MQQSKTSWECLKESLELRTAVDCLRYPTIFGYASERARIAPCEYEESIHTDASALNSFVSNNWATLYNDHSLPLAELRDSTGDGDDTDCLYQPLSEEDINHIDAAEDDVFFRSNFGKLSILSQTDLWLEDHSKTSEIVAMNDIETKVDLLVKQIWSSVEYESSKQEIERILAQTTWRDVSEDVNALSTCRASPDLLKPTDGYLPTTVSDTLSRETCLPEIGSQIDSWASLEETEPRVRLENVVITDDAELLLGHEPSTTGQLLLEAAPRCFEMKTAPTPEEIQLLILEVFSNWMIFSEYSRQRKNAVRDFRTARLQRIWMAWRAVCLESRLHRQVAQQKEEEKEGRYLRTADRFRDLFLKQKSLQSWLTALWEARQSKEEERLLSVQAHQDALKITIAVKYRNLYVLRSILLAWKLEAETGMRLRNLEKKNKERKHKIAQTVDTLSKNKEAANSANKNSNSKAQDWKKNPLQLEPDPGQRSRQRPELPLECHGETANESASVISVCNATLERPSSQIKKGISPSRYASMSGDNAVTVIPSEYKDEDAQSKPSQVSYYEGEKLQYILQETPQKQQVMMSSKLPCVGRDPFDRHTILIVDRQLAAKLHILAEVHYNRSLIKSSPFTVYKTSAVF